MNCENETWRCIDPGPGYRLVEPGEKLTVNDEHWICGKWSFHPEGATGFSGETMKAHWAPSRRKLPLPGINHRLLVTGERVQEGDEIFCKATDGSPAWRISCSGEIGATVGSRCIGVRRCTVGSPDFDRSIIVGELREWLNQQRITSDNIGVIRCQCFMPWSSKWNSIVREETAARENLPKQKYSYSDVVDAVITSLYASKPTSSPVPPPVELRML